MTPIYYIRPPVADDYQALMMLEQVDAIGTEIAMNLKSKEEWLKCISTYEHSRVFVDTTSEDKIWGYHLTAQVENNLYIKEFFISKPYRSRENSTENKKLEGFGGLDKKPLYTICKTAKLLGGKVIAPIASDNNTAISAMLGLYGFVLEQTLPEWFENGKDCNIYTWDN